MMTNEEIIYYDRLVEEGIATEEEINLAFNVSCVGWTEVLSRILYVRTGYRNWEQYYADLGGSEE